MKTSRVICAIGLLLAVGCRPGREDAQRTDGEQSADVTEQTVTVSGNDPFIVFKDGTKLGVDGLSPNQSVQLKLIHYTENNNGTTSIDVDSVSETDTNPKQP
jgi:hypothetical protein